MRSAEDVQGWAVHDDINTGLNEEVSRCIILSLTSKDMPLIGIRRDYIYLAPDSPAVYIMIIILTIKPLADGSTAGHTQIEGFSLTVSFPHGINIFL